MTKTVAAFAAVAAAALLVSSIDAAPPAKAKSPWQLFGGTKVTVDVVELGPVWAANRVWVLPSWGDAGILAGARVSGRTLRSFTAQRLSAGDVRGVLPTGASFVDGRLVVRTGDGRPDDALATAPLLPDGRLGARKVVPDDLLARAKEAAHAPRIEAVGIQSGVRVGNRFVWALVGSYTIGFSGGKEYQLVCCSKSGAATDLTRLIQLRASLFFVQIALDTHGRLWLAWLDRRDYPHAVRGVPRMIELDRSSLAPRGRPLGAPGVVANRLKLACAGSCRVVATTKDGDIISWARARSATRVASGWRPGKVAGVAPALLLAATYRWATSSSRIRAPGARRSTSTRRWKTRSGSSAATPTARGPERLPRSPWRARGRPQTPGRPSLRRSSTRRSRRVVSSRSRRSDSHPTTGPRSWAPSCPWTVEAVDLDPPVDARIKTSRRKDTG